MKICGIIAEYNPFHNGHKYHIEQSMNLSGADYNIVVMSGNFVQRGAPALMDKHTRTNAVLLNGADLVIELPVYYATGSAEYFSNGAVSLLDQLGVVTHLCFGSECGHLSLLQEIASIYANEPEAFKESLQRKLKLGHSFPVARAAALIEVCPHLSASLSVLSSPNNILGIEYIKSLIRRNSSIQPLTITRSGSGYHDRELTNPLSSATAIRQALGNKISLKRLSDQLPPEALSVYQEYSDRSAFLYPDDLSSLLHYKLLSCRAEGYTSYMDVSEDLSDRIAKNLYKFKTFSQFCDLLKTKELTHSRISRSLLHILLDIRKNDVDPYVQNLDYTPYARILGFRRQAAPLLHELGTHTQIPLVSKLADAYKVLDEPSLSMLKREITASDIYNSVRSGKSKSEMTNEYSTPIVIL